MVEMGVFTSGDKSKFICCHHAIGTSLAHLVKILKKLNSLVFYDQHFINHCHYLDTNPELGLMVVTEAGEEVLF